MKLSRFKWNDKAKMPEDAWDACEKIAKQIARDANRNVNTAEIGITWRRLTNRDGEDVVRIGPRGAAAAAVEVGTAHVVARRPVKRAIDKARIR